MNKHILHLDHKFLSQEALKAAHMGFWSYNNRDGTASWCPALYALLGREVGDYPEHPEGWLSLVHPLDQVRVRKCVEDALINNTPLYDIELRMRHAEGFWIKVQSRGRVVELDNKGYPIRTLGMVRYLCEAQSMLDGSRDMEYLIRHITEQIPEVFWVADPDTGSIDYVSDSYETIWGRPVAELYERPKSFMESIHPDDFENVLIELMKQKEGLRFDHEYRIIRPDNCVRWIWDRGFPLINEDGQVMQYIGFAQDITTRKNTEISLCQRIRELEEELNRLKKSD